jgi:holo-[acyl-carrier protein] synthase
MFHSANPWKPRGNPNWVFDTNGSMIKDFATLSQPPLVATPMKILGHGIDLVDIAEVQRWLDDPRDPLAPRCFTSAEISGAGDGPNRAEHLAGRFATKEAVLKALGVGFGDGIALADVETVDADHGSPEIVLHSGAAAVAAQRGVTKWFLSVSHENGMAIASVIAIAE